MESASNGKSNEDELNHTITQIGAEILNNTYPRNSNRDISIHHQNYNIQ